MKKSRIVVLIILGILLVIGIIASVIHINNKKNFKSSNNERFMTSIVMKGFELKIPDRYMATYDGTMGLMYWNNDHFDMMIDVEAGNYNQDVVDNLDELNTMMESELQVVVPYNEISIDGRRYTYMLYYDAGIPTLHCYTMADEENLFAVMVLCNEMAMIKPQSEYEIKAECEELIGIADSIIKTSVTSDKEDSPSGEVFVGKEAYESMYSEVELNLSQKYIPNDYVQGISTLAKLHYDVKADYYCTGSKSKEGIYFLKFYGDYNDNLITVSIEEKITLDYDLYAIIEEGCKTWTKDSEVYQYAIGDNICYYYTYQDEYVEDNDIITTHNYVSVMDLGGGYIMSVEGKGQSEEINNPEFYKDFYNVNLEKIQ